MMCCLFFFQAEDGIRDDLVTGVQTCALPISAPISLTAAVPYVWLGQALLALQPWIADPEIGQAVRTGGVGYDRLRPLDAYGYWYARSVGWMLARALPRAVLMVLAAGIVLP